MISSSSKPPNPVPPPPGYPEPAYRNDEIEDAENQSEEDLNL